MPKFNPHAGIKYVPFPRHMVEAIDALISYRRRLGVGTSVQGEAGWKVLDRVVELYKIIYDKEWSEFVHDQTKLLRELKHDLGHVKEGDSVVFRGIAMIPYKLDSMIDVFFPDQKRDKRFMYELAIRQPEFKMFKRK